MSREFSIYLDLVRFIAAMLVVLYHSNMRLLSTQPLPFSNHGHAAVIVFFVLSGYVIAYITATREREPLDYWSSRLSRFYSLVIPAVLLCPLLDMAGEAMASQFYDGKTTHDLAWLRILTSLAYLNEVWHISIMSFSNVPFWSVCYEMWYYVMFAVLMFTRGKPRLLLMLACILLLGPKILLLAPVWALGVMLHRWQALRQLPAWLNWTLFLASWPLYALFQSAGMTEYGSDVLLGLVGPHWHRELAFSKFFVTDYLLALIVAANFIGMRGVAGYFAVPLLALERPVRWLAAYTFSLYLLHQPLLQFFAAAIDGDPHGKLFYASVLGATLLSVWAIASVTEHRRHALRRHIQGWLAALTGSAGWRRVAGALAPPQAGSR